MPPKTRQNFNFISFIVLFHSFECHRGRRRTEVRLPLYLSLSVSASARLPRGKKKNGKKEKRLQETRKFVAAGRAQRSRLRVRTTCGTCPKTLHGCAYIHRFVRTSVLPTALFSSLATQPLLLLRKCDGNLVTFPLTLHSSSVHSRMLPALCSRVEQPCVVVKEKMDDETRVTRGAAEGRGRKDWGGGGL